MSTQFHTSVLVTMHCCRGASSSPAVERRKERRKKEWARLSAVLERAETACRGLMGTGQQQDGG